MSDSPQQLTLPLEKHRNHYLFSDYYLNTLLPRQSSWREADAEAAQALEALHQLHADKRALLRPALSESALEDEWIRPILDLLDHTYHVGASLPSPEGTRTPDYALFPDEATRRAALPHLGTADFFGAALAVADAKRWDRSLDRRLTGGAGDAFSNANPSYQIDYYLRITGRDWGLLTNGRLWRLYHRESSFRLDSYYEVDLINLLRQGQVEDFKYFYLFFRRAAFPEFLDRVLQESREYAQGVSEDLKERVYEALRLLAEGFLRYPGTSLTPVDLKEIHDNALILLYRLLFIFYAESRRLLPLENRSYAGLYSLKAIKEAIADRLGRRMTYLPRRATIWDNLKALFHIINEGSGELGVPAYNGRLFDPTKYPFLEDQAIGDAYIVQALDLLARAQGPQGLDFVDYRDLEIRHLGSIYEGLLEYQLRYADRDMAVIKDRKRERVVPAEEGQEVVFPASTVYPVTERGERKATGSYYTPGYIVKYIVENTLGPLVDEKQRVIQDRLTGLEAKLKAARGENRKLLERELGRVREGFGEAVLDLKVLDPAMGSGHFLVEATDYLAQRILDFGVRLGAGAEGSEGEVTKGEEETEISYWRRRAVESCIYGVDVNPLAVELAKLSLWLATAAKGKPLSFLDHHLRCGNSLIGARLADLGGLPSKRKRKRVAEEQMALFDESAFTRDMGLAVGGLATIQELASDSVEDIHEKERIFQELLEVHLKRWRQIADLWASAYFGNEMAPEDYAGLVQWVQTGRGMLPDAQAQPYLDRAHALWREKRFFHWELEFPEVFFDRFGHSLKDQKGFDAVVGNPPYVKARMGEDMRVERRRIAAMPRFVALKHMWDFYVAFMEAALQLLASGGFFSFIIPDAFNTATYSEPIKRIYFDELHVVSVSHYPVWEIFEGIGIRNIIPVVRKIPGTLKRSRRIIFATPGDVNSSSSEFVNNNADELYVASAAERIPDYSVPTIPLGMLCFTSYGLRLNSDRDDPLKFRKRDLVSPTPTPRCWKEYTEGKHLGRYSVEEIKYVEWGSDRCPTRLVRPTFPELYRSPKLLLGRQTRNVAYDDRDVICDNTCMVCTLYRSLSDVDNSHVRRYFHSLGAERTECERASESYSLLYLCALLNSKTLQHQLNTFRPGHIDAYPDDWKRLSIRRIEFTTPQEERARLVEEGLQRYEAYLEHGEDVSVRAFVATRLLMEEEPEQADVVHDLLAHLAEQMIEMRKAKNEEVRGFLDWLAGYTGLLIEEWSLKTNLKTYYQHDWTEIRRVLDRNRRKITKVNVKGREASDLIRDEWEASVEKLRPLLARIAATDRLIDLIVYRLYGLTGEEVKVVEGE